MPIGAWRGVGEFRDDSIEATICGVHERWQRLIAGMVGQFGQLWIGACIHETLEQIGATFCAQGIESVQASSLGSLLEPRRECIPGAVGIGVIKLLRRVVRNLLENARRYSSGDSLVRLQREGGFGVLRVCDRGPGVPPELRERIFEPFYRLPGASEHAGGVGLGLALVKSITLRMGGTVHCEANPGGGACFVVRLPLAPGY